LLTSVNIWLISWALAPGSISLLEVLAINPIIVFALLVVPLSPGGLGVRQVSFAGLFFIMGAGAALGTAVGLLQQFIGYLVSRRPMQPAGGEPSAPPGADAAHRPT
jgi:uncharacterized membrane protein YbhN (UPF0104 family)